MSPGELVLQCVDELRLGANVDAIAGSVHAALAPGDGIGTVLQQLGMRTLPEGVNVQELQPTFAVFSSIAQAAVTYTPSPLPLIVSLVRAMLPTSQADAQQCSGSAGDYGWRDATAGTEQAVHWLAGARHDLLSNANVRHVTAVLVRQTTPEGGSKSRNRLLSGSSTSEKEADAHCTWSMCAPEVAQTKTSAEEFENSTARQLVDVVGDGLAPRVYPISKPEGQSGSFSVAIALRGTSCVLPGGTTGLTSFCRVAQSNHDTAGVHDRWAPTATAAHDYLLVRPQLFDHRIFALATDEARNIDPQQRHVLEQSYASLHASGSSRTAVHGRSLGVAVGIWRTEFAMLQSMASCTSVYTQMNVSISVASGRVSFALGLHGPCSSIDTACSSSLVACHSAVRALQHDECATHILTGVNLILVAQQHSGGVQIQGMASVSRRCLSFDRRADGYQSAEACSSGVLNLGELLNAPRLRSTAVQQDGRSASLTAPNGLAQAQLLHAVFGEAAVGDSGLSLLEAHATGTPLGDPIEMGAIVKSAAPLGQRSGLRASCAKANVAHSETGAGMTGLLALILAMGKGEAMPNAQLRTLNPHLSATMSGAGVLLPTSRALLPPSRSISETVASQRTPRPVVSPPSSLKLFDTSSLSAFRRGISSTATAAMHLNLIGLGAELGYWRSLCDGAKTCAELARDTSCNPRYTREWCLAMATSGLLQYAEASGSFALVQQVMPAMHETNQLILTCDLSVVTRDRSRLLDLCRQGGSSVDADWAELCVPLAASVATPSVRSAQAGRLLAMDSVSEFWSSLRRTAVAVKRLHLIGLGAELGYWRLVCRSPVTSSELAHGIGCDQRYTDDWCIAMASSGLLDRDEATGVHAVAT